MLPLAAGTLIPTVVQAAEAPRRLVLPSPTIIPLAPREDPQGDRPGVESEEERLLRLRRELNVAVRETPENLGAWIQLAGLQDSISQYVPLCLLVLLLCVL